MRRAKPGLLSTFAGVFGVALLCGCGSVEPGQDFQYAEVVFDEGYFYCVVEPMLFNQGCGPGDESLNEGGNCHYNVTTFILRDYSPLLADSCGDRNAPSEPITPQAQSNYQAAQRQMSRDPDRAPLLLRPTRQTAHPREIFGEDSAPADRIREWATRFSSQ